uniref:Nuclear factor of activated T cells 3a n=1 Tax=Neogobius melanostomus TaxID=47308 RepID=A0A8C6V4V8_9GOBI
MTTANCAGNEELDFRLMFGEDSQQQPLDATDLEPDDNTSFYVLNVGQPQSIVSNHQTLSLSRHGVQSHSQVISAAPRFQLHKQGPEHSGFESQDKYGTSPLLPSAPVEAPKAFECPSIKITSISPSCQQEMDANEDVLRANGPNGDYHGDRPLSRDHLYLPLDHSYRDTSLSPSPCSSLSSRSWFSDASSCESFSHVYDDVDSELNEAAARFTLGSPLTSPGCASPQAGVGLLEETPHWQHHHPAFMHHAISLSPRQSPCHSPRTSVTDENWLSPRPPSRPSSRPNSPCGKRRHSSADICYGGSASPHRSPTPTPGPSPRGSVTEDSWLGSPSMGLAPFQCCPSEADIPSKTRKTSQDRTAMQPGKGDMGMDDPGNMSPNLDSPSEEALHGLKKDGPGEQFLSVPSHFSWNKPKPGHTPIFRTSSLPPLDWPLPSQFGQYDLKIELQPKAHHRAHYETEGSRGAVKAVSGGHPVVKLIGYSEKPVNLQMFIGTADDRYLRPHAFYQVHRITGKTVATASQEILVSSTKVLEIPLLPENNMTASIDCAGILKLRNSDIELRKGETDIGRKNTRVRVVFRVHIPQANGKVLSLQAASIPVECSQRSAQELPQVEKSSLTSCLVSGGEEMLITGSNFFSESKVIFLEKGPVLVKQEHREDLDLPAAAPLTMPLAHSATLVRTQLPSPEHGAPPDSLLSSSPHGLATGSGPGLLAPHPSCPSLSPPSFQHLPHLQGHSVQPLPTDCHMTFHPGPGPSALPAPPRPSYGPMHSHTHGPSLAFNGQSALGMQGYERLPFQQSASTVSHSVGLGMGYPSSSCPSPTAAPTSPHTSSPQGQQSLLSLHTLGATTVGPTPRRGTLLPLIRSWGNTPPPCSEPWVTTLLVRGRRPVPLHVLHLQPGWSPLHTPGHRHPSSTLYPTSPQPRPLPPLGAVLWDLCSNIQDSSLPRPAALSWPLCHPRPGLWCILSAPKPNTPQTERHPTLNRSQRTENPPSAPSAFRTSRWTMSMKSSEETCPSIPQQHTTSRS